MKKKTRKTYRSDILAAVHETATGMEKVGLIDQQTMREFDELCLTPISPFKPEDIANLRRREEVSQAIFARYLNVGVGLVSKWERGEKKPGGATLKLLSLVQKKGLSAIA